MVPAPLPKYEDLEVNLRTKAKEAWTVFFAFLSVLAVGGFVTTAIWGYEDLDVPQSEPSMLFMEVLLLLTTVVFAIRSWDDLRPQFGKSGFLQLSSWLGILLLAPLLALNFYYHTSLQELMGIETEEYIEYFSSKWGPIIFICVMPAILEEIAFRGIVQREFEKAVSPWTAILVASILFSAAHFSLLSAPYLALVGVLLGWLRWKTNSLYPSMAVHFLHNYVVVTYF